MIKGNAGELASLAGTTEVKFPGIISAMSWYFNEDPTSSQVESKGVDSVGSGFKDPENFVRNLAIRESKKFLFDHLLVTNH